MGNCTAKDSSEKKTKVKLNIKYTDIYDINQLFASAVEPMKSLESISSLFRKKTKKFKKSTFTHIIVNWTIADSLHGMLYIFAANQANIIEHLELKVIPDPPYLAINKNKLPQDVVRVYQDFEDLVEFLISAPGELEELAPQLSRFAEEAKDFPDSAKDICKINNLGPMDTVKTCKRVGKNVQKLAAGKTVVNETIENVRRMSLAMQEFCRDHHLYLPKVEELGKKARDANVLVPKQIISKYWPEQHRVDLKLDLPPRPKTQKK